MKEIHMFVSLGFFPCGIKSYHGFCYFFDFVTLLRSFVIFLNFDVAGNTYLLFLLKIKLCLLTTKICYIEVTSIARKRDDGAGQFGFKL